MTHYSLLFGFRDLVAGRGFLAGVAVNGRALLRHDDNGFWMHGVNPGGLSAGGVDTGEAQRAFRETYRTILFDIAADVQNFEEFKAETVRFFEEVSGELLSQWTEAGQDVREGEVHAEGYERPREACMRYMDETLRDLPCKRLQTAVDADTKLIP